MRLIDADNLAEKMKAVHKNAEGVKRQCYSFALGIIEGEPIIDGAPVAHGRWLFLPFDDVSYSCSNCINGVDVAGYNYCPFCGAKMDFDEALKNADD